MSERKWMYVLQGGSEGHEAWTERIRGEVSERLLALEPSRLELTLTEANGSVVLTVDDDEPGIPTAERDRLFDRFTRLDEARDRDHGGAGLGLAIVKEIIEHHRGTITIAESSQNGTRVTITLPSASASNED